MSDGDTIKLTEDIDYSSYVKVSESEAGQILNLANNSVLDLNGNDLKVQKLSIAFQGNNVTLKDGSITALPSTTYALFIWDDENKTNNLYEKDGSHICYPSCLSIPGGNYICKDRARKTAP